MSNTNPKKNILHIDINAFFASVEEANNPNLRNKPVVVAGLTKRSVISSPNYKARKYGIKAGMPLFVAKNMCKNLQVVPHKFELYEEYSHKFIDLLAEQVSNRIEYISIDECYMDITNLVSTGVSPMRIAQRIQKLVKDKIGLGTSIGVSYNRFLAKMGSDYKKPMGITQIENLNDIKATIWPQPIENMYFVGKSSARALIQNNIRTIGDLAKCKDQKMLANIFGKKWNWYYENANGIGDDELVYSYGEPKSISISRTLLNDTTDFNEIKYYLREFSKKISERLSEHNLLGRTISVYIKDPDFKLHTKALTLNKYIEDQDSLYVNFLDMYEKNFLNKKIRLVGCGISNLVHSEELMSTELFNDAPKIRKTYKNDLKEIVDSINNKFSKNILKLGSKLK